MDEQKIRNSNKYMIWKNAVWESHNGKCVATWRTSDIDVHHIKPFCKLLKEWENNIGWYYEEVFENKVWELSNWVPLTKHLHIKLHSELWMDYSVEEFWEWVEDNRNTYKSWDEEIKNITLWDSEELEIITTWKK